MKLGGWRGSWSWTCLHMSTLGTAALWHLQGWDEGQMALGTCRESCRECLGLCCAVALWRSNGWTGKQQGLDAFSHVCVVQGMTGVHQLTEPVSGLQKQLLVNAVWQSSWVMTKAGFGGGAGPLLGGTSSQSGCCWSPKSAPAAWWQALDGGCAAQTVRVTGRHGTLLQRAEGC